jgi:hypothetical protein
LRQLTWVFKNPHSLLIEEFHELPASLWWNDFIRLTDDKEGGYVNTGILQ